MANTKHIPSKSVLSNVRYTLPFKPTTFRIKKKHSLNNKLLFKMIGACCKPSILNSDLVWSLSEALKEMGGMQSLTNFTRIFYKVFSYDRKINWNFLKIRKTLTLFTSWFRARGHSPEPLQPSSTPADWAGGGALLDRIADTSTGCSASEATTKSAHSGRAPFLLLLCAAPSLNPTHEAKRRIH